MPDITTQDWTIILNCISLLILGFTAYVAWRSNVLTKTINRQEIARERNNALISLYDHISDIPHIDLEQPVWDDATTAINKLELIAVAYSTQLTHRRYLYLLLSKLYIEVYEEIRDARDPNDGEYKGKRLIAECPTATKLYQKWKKQRQPRRLSSQRANNNQIKELQDVKQQQTKNGRTGRTTNRGTS